MQAEAAKLFEGLIAPGLLMAAKTAGRRPEEAPEEAALTTLEAPTKPKAQVL